MSPKKLTAFRLDGQLLKALQEVRDTEVPEKSMAGHVEIAIRDYLMKRGHIMKSDRKRASTRKRP